MSMGADLRHTVYHAFDRAGLRWCVLREDPSAQQIEVDLLVDPRHRHRAESVLRAYGCVLLPSWGRGSHRFFLLYDPASDSWTKFDIVTEFAFGRYQELRIDAAQACLARRRACANHPRLNPDDEFWALLLHGALDRSQLSDYQRDSLAGLAPHAQTGGPLARWVARACAPAEIIAMARTEDWDALVALGAWLRARRPMISRLAARGRAAKNRLVRAALRPVARIRRRTLSVALLAPDGAGKSTLQRELASTWPLQTWTAYLGLYPQPTQQRLRGLAPARRLARFWFRYAIGRAWQARGRLVIYDRHPVDALIVKEATHGRRLRRWLIAHACPLPDLVIVLDTPGSVLHARKPEREVDELDDQRARYRSYARHSPNVVVIDASRDLDTVRRQVTRVVWERWSARFMDK
jgi:hypothetical protein